MRLYKQGLDEIKYFQNEMTNIESKYLALYVASESAVHEGVLNTINLLASTERNFILEKDQSTAHIELKKIESTDNGLILDKISNILPNLVRRT